MRYFLKMKKGSKKSKKFKKPIYIAIGFFFILVVSFLAFQLNRVGWKFFRLKSKFCLKNSQCISSTCCCPGTVDNIWYPFSHYGFRNPKISINGYRPSCLEGEYKDCGGYGTTRQEVICNFFLCSYKDSSPNLY